MCFLTRSRNSQRSNYLLSRISILFEALLLAAGLSLTSTAAGQNSVDVLATVNGQAITLREVDDSIAASVVPLQQQLYALRKVALENIIIRRLIESEATRKNVPVEVFRKTLMEGPVSVTREEVEEAYEQNASFFATMSPDEAKERLRLDLESRARMKYYRASLERLRESSSIVINLALPTVALGRDPDSQSTGSRDSPVTIIEFSDFECPFCGAVQPTLKRVLMEYGGKVRLVFKNLPLDQHRNSTTAARAAYCAGQQDRFWQYHDSLFASRNLEKESLYKLARDLGLEIRQFEQCLSSPSSLNAITKDIDDARRFRLQSTPSFIINGNLTSGALSFAEFKTIIDRELERTTSKRSSTN